MIDKLPQHPAGPCWALQNAVEGSSLPASTCIALVAVVSSHPLASAAEMEVQHAAAFAAGAALGVAALYLYTRSIRLQQTAAATGNAGALEQQSEQGGGAAGAAGEAGRANGSAAAGPLGASSNEFDMSRFDEDEILEEQLTRNVQFFGLDGQRRIGGAFVVVVGLGVSCSRAAAVQCIACSAASCGVVEAVGLCCLVFVPCVASRLTAGWLPACMQGVGSHAAHLLLRSGVGRLRLIDFDQLTLSSLNRHCLATRADVGTPKAACLARHFAGQGQAAAVQAGGVAAAEGCLLCLFIACRRATKLLPKLLAPSCRLTLLCRHCAGGSGGGCGRDVHS